MKSALIPDSNVITPGGAMVKSKLDGHRKAKRIASVNSVRYKEFPTTHWAHAVATLVARSEPAVLESNRQLPENFSASDFDVVRARTLSSQI